MGNPPLLLFCIGATKAGTSWFHQFLEMHPECHLRGVKELHYFDAQDLQSKDWQIGQLERERQGLQDRLQASETEPDGLRQRVDDYQDLIKLHVDASDDAYLNYLTKGSSGQRLVADVTPAYGLLSSERFAQMASIAPEVRFLYFLRDPVARLWSHIRMLAGRRVVSEQRIQEVSQRIFWRFGRGRFPAVWERSDYRETLNKLDRVVGPGQLFTVFYEELFSQKAINKICEFLGINAAKADVKTRVHSSPTAQMDDNMLAHAQKWLAPQYEFVRQRAGYVPQEWRANMSGVRL